MARGHIDVHNVGNHSFSSYFVRSWGKNTYQKHEMTGKVYVKLCERARTADIEVVLAGLVDRQRSHTTAS